jgi:hypothetical protein
VRFRQFVASVRSFRHSGADSSSSADQPSHSGQATRAVARRVRRRSLVLGLGLLLPSSLLVTGNAVGAATTYYVDCAAGNDTNAGTSTGRPWKSLSKANNAPLQPGGSLLLKRGCTWTGPLQAKWNGTSSAPITIGAYGSGAQPRIQNARDNVVITGTYQVIRDLFTRADAPGYDAGCNNQPAGWRVGFRFMSGAAHNTLRDSTATGLYIGILAGSGSHHNRIISNTLMNNNMIDADTSSDAGAVGITLAGDDNEVSYNTISGSDACSRHYGRDGSAIEVYGGRRNSIHHNRARENNTFTELGNSRSADNTYAYNEVTSSLPSATFLVTRGPNNKYGPVYGTAVYNTTVYLTGSSSYALQCYGGCSPSVLVFRNNIVWGEDRIGYADAPFDEGNNIYWRSDGAPPIWFSTSSSSRKADPRFVNRSASDFRLADRSPAVDTGSRAAVDRGYTQDLLATPVPQGPVPDIGAYERRGTATYVADQFSRTLSDSWGSAPMGGTYTTEGSTADFDVNGAAGTMRVARGAMRAAYLPAVAALDVDTTFRARMDKVPTGGSSFAYFVARRPKGSTDEYRLKVRVAPTGVVYVQATKVVVNKEVGLATEVNTGVKYAAGGDLWVRAQVVGTSPVTLGVKVWSSGEAEPSAWHYSFSDLSSALTGAGGAGLRAYVSQSTTNGPILFTFDDWTVRAP